MKRKAVLNTLHTHRTEILQRGVKSLALFGSVARDEATSESDVDLLVEFEHPIGLFEFIGLKQYLESLLGCKVDLGTTRSLRPYLKEQVLQEAILVT
jgi:uncharacterized protein